MKRDITVLSFIFIAGIIIGLLWMKGCSKTPVIIPTVDSSAPIKKEIINLDSIYKVKIDSGILISKQKDSVIAGLKSNLAKSNNKVQILRGIILADSTLSPAGHEYVQASDQRNSDCDSVVADLTAENAQLDSTLAYTSQMQDELTHKMAAYFRTTSNNTVNLNNQIFDLTNKNRKSGQTINIIKWAVPVAFIAGFLLAK